MVPLKRGERGYASAVVGGVEPGSRYFYRLHGQQDFPDPASRFQPLGVHGPSQVVQPGFSWGDAHWSGLPLSDYVIYELHVGTFTPEGTFDAIIPYLDELKELGLTALELMPVAQFPGGRNWGYDGVYPFAVQNSYGGPEGLKRLVNACHQRGLAVVLDVVYNHLGPEGNYLANYGPYFTQRYRTPWGPALNFDGPDSDEVRRFFIDNALFWSSEYHIDALRLDALHAIVDLSPQPFLAELAATVRRTREGWNRKFYLMAESDLNDVRLVRSTDLGGYGLDAHWNDDFHHALHTLLTGEQTGYYADFGRLEQLAKAWREGFIYSGEYSPYRRRRHGSSSRDIAAERLVVFGQNHDQIGNRLGGERLSQLVSFEAVKLAAGVVLLSPCLPLLFMGEEYGEVAPFWYFVSHSDPALIEAVRKGRQEEFAAFQWPGEPPDPLDEATFARARLDHRLRREGEHRVLRDFYREALRLRQELKLLTGLGRQDRDVHAYEQEKVLRVRMNGELAQGLILFSFGPEPLDMSFFWPEGAWHRELDSADRRWGGPGSETPPVIQGHNDILLRLPPRSLTVYRRQDSC
ncbi:MAG: malto-oligosyltrehalose trehalohydrolase [Syntrophobacterales bacterium RIFOXYC2_FULL_60_23]|nr:MAG: malto-oligosyltrehalose trehalohydrolase [Syntrophobacterales bacterium RIFOXYC2_FULL_60_23]